jgi:hypothetical protein
MNTSHSPFLSQPAALATVLREELAPGQRQDERNRHG